MSQKQDRINDVLAQRISQLEDELQSSRCELSAALGQKDRAEKEIKLLKDEAFEVVEQWSAENTDLRRRLSDVEKKSTADQAALRNRDDTIACLKEELGVAQQLLAQHTTDIQDQQQKHLDLERENAELLKTLASTKADLSSSAQRVADYEHLVTKFQVELKDMLASRKKDAEALDCLRSSLAQSTAENQALREAGANVSSSMERLLERVTKLKEEKESLRKNNDCLLSANDELTRQRHRDEEKQRQLSEEVAQLQQNCDRAEKQFVVTTRALQESQSAAEQQLQLIQTLESDVREQKDREISTKKMLCELQTELLRLNEQLNETSKQKEDLDTEFTAVKDSYATTLMEFDNYKRTSSIALAAVQAEFSTFKRDSTERCMLAEQSSSTAWSSVQELTGALRAQQLSDLAQREQIMRSSILLDQQVSFDAALEHRFHALQVQLSDSSQALVRAEELLIQSEISAAKTSEELSTLSKCCRTNEQITTEQRKALSLLESQLNQSGAQFKQVALERDNFAQDNAWLKDQVESMRQELGGLDELLNANLNEIREENERLQLENDSLKHRIAAADQKCEAAGARITDLETVLSDLEGELRAQTKTLEITEAELQALKAQAQNFSTSLDISKKRCEELEILHIESTRSNSALMLQVTQLQERLGTQDSKLSLILSDKRKESENMKHKFNAYVEKCEKFEKLLHAESKARKDVENACASAKEQNMKLRSALDELKIRCASDASTIKELLAERDDLIRDRDIIVEKYNKLHDAFRNVRREAHGKVADELKRVMELAISQEAELQTLRQQNSTLKKSISMFVESAQPKAEAVFMERLNLTEGPLRYPKKRSATSASESQ
ncbi:hypothetical protein JKF63_01021 [Porcisia hertigi]|uniref:Uncharacterized protein n=1 Tax=Porcisia hertigi TaxID=2761500 RepID=A0A836L9G6_9TRYP|nr:hypothetical protein JKF63_01021 [Porcisia hertigi]